MLRLRKLGELTGFTLQARDGDIGKLEQIYFDDHYWTVRYFIVHTGGWLLGKDVLIAPPAVTGVDEENNRLEVELTREQVSNCPPVDTRLTVSRHYQQEYYRYYGWEPYWGSDAMFTPAPYVPPVAAGEPEEPREPEHPHLRSSKEVRGYHIHALDGEIGHVEDFILEDPGWAVSYLVIDTRNWLPGKSVLVAPAWIRHVDWARQEVTVNLSRDALQSAPPYDSSTTLNREYEAALHAHYGLDFNES